MPTRRSVILYRRKSRLRSQTSGIRCVPDSVSILFSRPSDKARSAFAQAHPFRHQLARFEQTSVPEVTGYDVELHEHPVVRGRTGKLRSHMIHHDFDDLHHYLTGTMSIRIGKPYYGHDIGSRSQRRNQGAYFRFGSGTPEFVKRLFLSLPGKPVIYFLYSYICAPVFWMAAKDLPSIF